jgi:AcrR family transcriptional regulator
MSTDADLPPPPWRTPPRARDRERPVRQPLTRTAIVEVALRILDAEGVDGLSMRRIAQELDTGPSSLYAHVSSKDELLELLLDRIAGGVPVPAPDPERWQDQLKQIARDTHRSLVEHADIARAALANIPTGPNALRVAEGMLTILLAGGLPARIAAWALDRIFLYVTADAFESSLYIAKVRASGQPVEEYITEYFAQLGRYYRALPADRFPALAGNVDALMSGDGDQRFEFGLDMLVDGLSRYLPDR